MSKGCNIELFESLNKKGAIINGQPIEHEKLMANNNLRRSLSLVEIDYLKYLRGLQEIKYAYEQSKDWNKVINGVVNNRVKGEAFIDYVEEIYKTKVKNAKHLKQLTGCREHKDTELQDLINENRLNKYYRALRIALNKGAKYKDLLQIKPQDFGLPKTWTGGGGSDQYSSILWALSSEFLIEGQIMLMFQPDLRSIAQEIEAPYSVVMDCYKRYKF